MKTRASGERSSCGRAWVAESAEVLFSRVPGRVEGTVGVGVGVDDEGVVEADSLLSGSPGGRVGFMARPAGVVATEHTQARRAEGAVVIVCSANGSAAIHGRGQQMIAGETRQSAGREY